MYKGLGATGPDLGGWCGTGNPFVDFFCSEESKRSTVEQIITDTSDYGSQLSLANRLRAEEMARATIAADDPCNYSEISGMSWPRKVACGFEEELGLKPKGGAADYVTLALVIGGVALFMIAKH